MNASRHMVPVSCTYVIKRRSERLRPFQYFDLVCFETHFNFSEPNASHSCWLVHSLMLPKAPVQHCVIKVCMYLLVYALLVRPSSPETTALGAAICAGLATGFWSSLDDVRTSFQTDGSHTSYTPDLQNDRVSSYEGWKVAAKLTFAS